MDKKIVVPPGVCYRCHQCGDCCRRMTIVLFPGERERIEALDWTGRRPELIGARSVVRMTEPGYEGKICLARRPDDACLFLGERNQCLIHEHFGMAAKPLACRMAPFALIPTGDRLAIDVSFYCPGVGAEGEGREPVLADSPEWEALFEEFPYKTDARHHSIHPSTPESGPRPPISGNLLWEIEGYLLDFLAERRLPFVVRIRCVQQFLAVATSGDPASPTAAEFRQAMAKGVVKQVLYRLSFDGTMDRTQQALFYQLLYLVLNPIPRYVYDLSPAEQAREQQRLIARGTQFRDRQGSPIIGNRDLKIGFNDVQRVDASYFNSVDCILPELFFTAGIVGQRFLILGGEEQPLIEAVARYLLYYPMMIWTAKALAAERRVVAVEPEDVRQAVHLIGNAVYRFYMIKYLPPKILSACNYLLVETDMLSAVINDMMAT